MNREVIDEKIIHTICITNALLQAARQRSKVINFTFERGRSSSVKIAVSSDVGGVVTSGNVTSR